MLRVTFLLSLFILLATLASAAILPQSFLPQAVPHLHHIASSAIPVPGMYGLLSLGLSGLVFAFRRRA
jgi:hypothetical protein